MGKKEVYQAMLEHGDTTSWLSLSQWSDILNMKIAAATMTSLVNDGLIVRTKEHDWYHRNDTYKYRAISCGEYQALCAQTNKETAIKEMREFLDNYDDLCASIQEDLDGLDAAMEKEIQKIKAEYAQRRQWYVEDLEKWAQKKQDYEVALADYDASC
jgi:hypothetical protein